MKRAFFLSLFFLISSCGPRYYKPESVESKMARYNATPSQQNAPLIMDLPIRIDEVKRAPASAETPIETSSKFQGQNNKRLYFTLLYSQYLSLMKYGTSSNPSLEICPNFHNTLLTFSETKKTVSEVSFEKYDSIPSSEWSKTPELYLSLSKTSPRPRVIDELEVATHGKPSVIVQKALQTHLEKTYSELAELCENGSSDNYYAFENLITLSREKKGLTQSKESVHSLLKVPVLTNEMILSSIATHTKTLSRTPASAASNGTEEIFHEIVTRMNAPWVKSYFRP